MRTEAEIIELLQKAKHQTEIESKNGNILQAAIGAATVQTLLYVLNEKSIIEGTTK